MVVGFGQLRHFARFPGQIKSCDEGKPYCFDFKDDYSSKFINITNQIIKKLQN